MTQTIPLPHQKTNTFCCQHSATPIQFIPVQKCVVLSEYLGAFAQVVADLDVAVMS